MPKKKDDNLVSLPELMLYAGYIKQQEEIEELKRSQRDFNNQIANVLLKCLELKDEYTFGHSLRVAHYSVELGKEYGLSEDELYILEMSALFHDIGKIGTPESILNKPSRLEEEEFKIMKEHPSLTYEVLKHSDFFEKIAKYSMHHHERYDGRGYPEGLKGDEIPLYSRMILIADTFDAMTSTRPYRKGLPYQVAFEELEEFSGSQFDPKLVKHFIKVMKEDEKKKVFHLNIIKGNWDKEAA